jgi:hypothetical protein
MKIIVQAAVPWPVGHNDTNESYSDANVERGKPTTEFRRTLTLGAPKEPNAGWICGTDLVWPVLELDGQKIEGDWPRKGPYVCRHQFEAGD